MSIVKLVHQGVRHFAACGACGFDTMAAQAVLQLKAIYPQLRLNLVLPCRDQTKDWEQKDVTEYCDILRQADEVIYTSAQYTRGCMHKRNRYLVDCSHICL